MMMVCRERRQQGRRACVCRRTMATLFLAALCGCGTKAAGPQIVVTVKWDAQWDGESLLPLVIQGPLMEQSSSSPTAARAMVESFDKTTGEGAYQVLRVSVKEKGKTRTALEIWGEKSCLRQEITVHLENRVECLLRVAGTGTFEIEDLTNNGRKYDSLLLGAGVHLLAVRPTQDMEE